MNEVEQLVFTNDKCVGCNKCIRVCSCIGACVSEEADISDSTKMLFETLEQVRNDLLELGFIGIEYCKEYTNEKLFFYFNYNSDKNDYNVELKDIYNRYGYDLKDYTEKNEENIYELILLYANNNFLFNNKNNNYLEYNISFKDFKNIFVNLPYLNDILFNNIYKIFSKSNTKLISNKNFKYDKISVYIINESTKIFLSFFNLNFFK